MKLLCSLVFLACCQTGCYTTTIQGRTRWPQWGDDIAKMCSQMAARNISHVTKRPKKIEIYEDTDIKKDQDIIDSDTRFYLGLVEYLQERKSAFALEESMRDRFGKREQ